FGIRWCHDLFATLLSRDSWLANGWCIEQSDKIPRCHRPLLPGGWGDLDPVGDFAEIDVAKN
ncbi:MAG: hypothetical protein AAGF98_09990, partial [Cyanobacteria bacterium P01_H01_bin.153]